MVRKNITLECTTITQLLLCEPDFQQSASPLHCSLLLKLLMFSLLSWVPSDSSSSPLLFQCVILMKERSLSKLRHLSNANNHCHLNQPLFGNLCVFIFLFLLEKSLSAAALWKLVINLNGGSVM